MGETAKNDEATKNTGSTSRKSAGSKATAARSATRRAAGAGASKATAASESAGSADAGEAASGRVVALSTKAKASGEFLASVPEKSMQFASTTWTLVKNRKTIAAGVGSGVIAALLGAYGLGRTAARRGHGPFTRATGGRF
ncbi:hypothetical protein [Streptomyces tropicalis]|uniref:Uncharacterized protein n=1 Tax=Streptomyces tropicalis TaxID=3034234 RepID=A0ABT6A5A2_9ACTN|nr:hypothetical protein [Streptomyces tropicalis]MDF3299541.1 hypothetical protein [Streptomyces tropicalis]